MGSTSEPTAPPLLDPPRPGTPAATTIRAKPPVWPSLLAPFLAVIAAALATGTVMAGLALLSDPALAKGNFAGNLERWMEDHAASFPTIAAYFVPAQLCFLGVAVYLAVLERERVLPRLGFVRWKAPGSTVALAVIGSLGVQFAIDLVAQATIHEPSESLRDLMRMFTEPRGIAVIGVGFLMSVLPGVCEEALFRGMTQRGLMRRWPPSVAIAVASAFFALAHFDVQHSIAVFPLGIWFGWVAWRTGSVWPAVLCHFANNLSAFVFLRVWGHAESTEMPDGPGAFAVGFALVAVTIVAILRLMRTGPERGTRSILPAAEK